MKGSIGFCFSIVFFIFVFVLPVSAQNLLIKNARLIDGTGSLPQEGISILIRDGMITAIGDNASAEDVQVLDADNATVLPGLIDSHVHLMWGPDGFLYGLIYTDKLLKDDKTVDLEYWRSTYDKYILQYLRAYLACGITTVLDAANYGEIISEIRSLLDAGNPGPRFLTLGTPLYPFPLPRLIL